MKLTKKQIKEINMSWGDWESVHGLHDDFMRKRLIELDPEFVKSLDDATRGATFWFA